MDKLNFTISEYVIRPDLPVPLDVADKILTHHIWPMNTVRDRLEDSIIVSKKSGYRPVVHEKEKGRDGGSTHCFRPSHRDPEGLGAADYTCKPGLLLKMAQLMQFYTEYTRLCFYPDHLFIHGDYAYRDVGQRVFLYQNGEWVETPARAWEKEIANVIN